MSDPRHLTEHQISASVDGVLQGASQEQVVRHLAECPECRARYEELVEHHQMLAELLAHEADDSFFAALESDVERALGAGDALPRGAVVSIRSTPSKPLGPTTPRPTLADSLNAIGPPPAWAPPGGVGAARPEAEARAIEPIGAPAIPAAPPAPPRPAAQSPPPAPPAPPRAVIAREPAPRHVFPDEIYEDEGEETAPEAPPRGARAGSIAVLSYALGAVAVIAVATLAWMLLRRADEAKSPPAAPDRVAATSPAVTPPAGEPDAMAPGSVVAEPPPGVTPAAITRIAPPASPAPSAAPEPARSEPPVRASKPAPAREAPAPRATKPPAREPEPVPVASAPPAVMAPSTRLVTEPPRPSNGPVRMCAVVLDANGGPVARAQVLVTGLTLGAITDATGRFCLTLPPGPHELRVSALGHAAGVHPVTVATGMAEFTITLRAGDAAP